MSSILVLLQMAYVSGSKAKTIRKGETGHSWWVECVRH